MKKIISFFLIVSFFSIAAQVSYGKQSGDWTAVKTSVNREIAVKTKNGKTNFGILRFADDEEIKVQIAGKKGVSGQETTFRRDEIQKVWQAELNSGERNTGKGALIGAAVGAAAGLGAVLAERGSSENDDGLIGAAIPLFAVAGAGIGAVVGFFSKKRNKKGDVLYSL